MTMKLSVQLILLSFFEHTQSHLSPEKILSSSVYPQEMSHSLPVGPSHPISEKANSTMSRILSIVHRIAEGIN